MPFFYFIAHVLDRSLLEYHPITVRENDIIFFADSFWNTETRKSFSIYADYCNILLLYDIIPIVKPEVCDDVHVNTFRTNFTGVLKHLDGIITISASEKEAVQCYLNADCLNGNNIPLDYYYLGGNFASGQQRHLQVRHAIDNALSSENTFLMVGTIEPRKNHAFVLDAFEKLWRSGENVSLCIVGKPGWKCSGLLQRIKSHERLGRSLFYFHDVNDKELSHCYDQCKAVVFASVAEGFGLPLVEAMSYGRNILASDIPVFREIGGNYPIYFSHDDVNALVRCIHDYTRGTFEKRQPRSWFSWDESVIDLFCKLLKMADGSKQSRDKNSVLQ